MSSENSQRKFSTKTLVFAVVFSLILGVMFGSRGSNIIASAASYLGIKNAAFVPSADFNHTQEVYKILKEKYNGDITEQKLQEYLAKGVAASTEDPYTEYYTAEEAAKLEKDLEGNIGGGIGAELGMRNDKATVIRALNGTPAAQAGLKSGDVILAVNDELTAGMTIDEVVQIVRGEIGTSAKLLIQRGSERLEVSVKRAEIVSPDVETEIKDGIGIIKLSRFGTDSAPKVRSAAENMKRQGVKGVVLDLRGNGGGYLQTGVDIASIWLNDKPVVSEKGVAGEKTLQSKKQTILEGVPTVVLIDAGSASASEIVAGALKDHNQATLMGEKSYGKGSVQELVNLPGGDMLKVTIANWYTPSGKNISEEGISPDEEVAITADDINNNRDPQLNAAINKLK